MEHIRIKLFNKYIDYYSDYIEDINIISFIYKKYITEDYKKDNNIEFCITGNRNSNLIISNQLSSINKNNKIEVKYKLENDPDYRLWGSANTFIPPIDSEIFHNKFLILHGVGIYKDNKSYFFLGNNFSGKSSILFYALGNGYQCISDDLIFYDIHEKKIIPYYKPAGIRSSSTSINGYFDELYKKIELINHFEFINYQNSVKTRIFHVDDIFSDSFIKNSVSINNIYIISNNQSPIENIKNRLNVLSKCVCSSNLSNNNRTSALLDIAFNTNFMGYIKQGTEFYELFKKI